MQRISSTSGLIYGGKLGKRWCVLTFVALLAFVCLARGAGGTDYIVTHSKIDDTQDGHGTTRTTVRHVFYYHGQWYVFCGDHRGGNPGTYYSFFVTSTDGVNWSARKIGSGGGITGNRYGSTSVPETPIVYGNTVYGAYTDSSTNNLMVRSGTLTDGNITWSAASVAAPGLVSPRETYAYYPDIMIETDGRLSMTVRHYYLDGQSKAHLDPAYIVSTNPGDITSWQAPHGLMVLPSPQEADGHENIPLPGGKRVMIFRTRNSNQWVPGPPGNFLAFHYDGSSWSAPVDLGNSDGIGGSDKRLCAMLDTGTGIVHLLYVEDSGTLWNNELRHRTLAPLYGLSDWSAPVTIDTNVFTVTMGMDSSSTPGRIVAVYGDHKANDGGRLHTGELYIKWFDGTRWDTSRQLVSEPATVHNWYPSVSQDASGIFGVLYTKGRWGQGAFELMFSLIEPVPDLEPDGDADFAVLAADWHKRDKPVGPLPR